MLQFENYVLANQKNEIFQNDTGKLETHKNFQNSISTILNTKTKTKWQEKILEILCFTDKQNFENLLFYCLGSLFESKKL